MSCIKIGKLQGKKQEEKKEIKLLNGVDRVEFKTKGGK